LRLLDLHTAIESAMSFVPGNSSDAGPNVNRPRAPLEFYFDFISPFGYCASLRVDALAATYGRAARWQAMLIGISVLKVMGLKPVPQTPLKGPYARRELQRYLRRHGLALKRDPDKPPSHPVPGGRAFHWIDSKDPVLAKRFAAALFAAYWQDDHDIGSVDELARVGESVGVERDALSAAISSGGEGDALLRAAVDRSLALGVFGSPFFIVDGEPFFGLDKMELMEAWLREGGW
jgi:2-hydroxychromene-2-carboxylate isomerase